MREHDVAEALSFLGSVQKHLSVGQGAAVGARCMTEALSSGSTSQTPPTLWDISKPKKAQQWSISIYHLFRCSGQGRRQPSCKWEASNVSIAELQNNWLKFGANLFHDEAGQNVHDKTTQSGIHGEGLDDGAHEQHGEGALLHQLLHYHCQHLRRVHILLPEAQVGSCSEDNRLFIAISHKYATKCCGSVITGCLCLTSLDLDGLLLTNCINSTEDLWLKG